MRLLRENTAFVKYKFNHAIKYTHNVFESKQKNSILNSDTLLYSNVIGKKCLVLHQHTYKTA